MYEVWSQNIKTLSQEIHTAQGCSCDEVYWQVTACPGVLLAAHSIASVIFDHKVRMHMLSV